MWVIVSVGVVAGSDEGCGVGCNGVGWGDREGMEGFVSIRNSSGWNGSGFTSVESVDGLRDGTPNNCILKNL